MSQTDKNISINVSTSHIREALRSIIKHPFSEKITDAIMGGLNETEVGMQQVLLAFAGIEPVVKWKVGDEVSVSIDEIGYWSFDKAKMTEAKMIFQGRIKAEVAEINLYKKKQIMVMYKCLDKSGDEKIDSYEVAANSIAYFEQGPADTSIGEPDDLPF